jgi:hypothetical protein
MEAYNKLKSPDFRSACKHAGIICIEAEDIEAFCLTYKDFLAWVRVTSTKTSYSVFWWNDGDEDNIRGQFGIGYDSILLGFWGEYISWLIDKY